MKLKDYFKTNIVSYIIYILTIILLTLLLLALRLTISTIICIIIIMIIAAMIITIYDYYRRKRFYNDFKAKFNALDKKYLIQEMIKHPSFYDGKLLCESLETIEKVCLQHLKQNDIYHNDFKEYIEMWIHEVKLPLASLSLMLHHYPSEGSQKMKEQVKRLNDYVEQVLYYVRSENSEKDYYINRISLKKVIASLIVNNKDTLLENNITITSDIEDIYLYSDSKWLEFMLNQILANSIKYSDEHKDKMIKISAYKLDNVIMISIYDNGIGIRESDLTRIFEKSFTGSNGRIQKSSTGMGLYIVKSLCDKLGYLIEVKSKEKQYCEVKIHIYDNEFYDVTR